MRRHKSLSVLAVSAVAYALLNGGPAGASAVTAAGQPTVTASPGAFGSMTPALAAQLSKNAGKPVIVVLKTEPRQAAVGTRAAALRAAAVAASQAPLMRELTLVRATSIKRFTLVNAVAATVSTAEERRLAANPTVAEVVPDGTVSIPMPTPAEPAASVAPAARAAAGTPTPALHDIPGACAPAGKSYLAPEGLSLTGTASDNPRQPTARSLGITGAGVKVAFIADGIDTKNVNFIRPDGTSVFVDYQDFTGDGVGAPTFGGESFLDANTIAGQGLHVYNVNGYSAQSYPGTCDVTIQGVAPGASLVGLVAYADGPGHDYLTTNSMLAEAINYAVETDHVNVLNESFGGNYFPDTTTDLVRLFDDAAVQAGVVVSVSSGDSGTTSTIGSPASDPSVISVGATTQFQMYAQSNFGYARYFATTGWLSDNISSLSSGGWEESGSTVDLVAPGDLSWISCDANVAEYSNCTTLLNKPTTVVLGGGTSESAPFVSGAAALVIQAYRQTHDNLTPAPALVKQILLSTATDLGIPAQEQGAGLLNTYKAVQLAESIGTSNPTGSTLLASTGQLNFTGLPGSQQTSQVTFTNTGATTQTVQLSGRALGPDEDVQTGSVTMSDATSGKLIDQFGYPNNYATFHFTVRPGQARLDVSIAWPGNPAKAGPALTLVDPAGRIAAATLPQSLDPDYGNVDVRAPAAGTWTGAIVTPTAKVGGQTGKVSWRAATEQFTSFGSVSPSSLTLAPGQAQCVTFSVTDPSSAGDTAGALVANAGAGGTTSIPVTVRTLVNVADGGALSGVLTGGNGRNGNLLAQDNYFQFTVPSGTSAITASVALANDPHPGVTAGEYLISPDGNALGYGQNSVLGTPAGTTDPTLAATVLNPVRGTWTLIVDFAGATPGTELSDPFSGHVTFTTGATETAPPLPARLPAGKKFTFPVTITNTSPAPEDFFLDPRLSATATLTLAPLTAGFTAASNTSTLPLTTFPSSYFVPSQTSAITVSQTSTGPAMVDLSPDAGDPDVGSAGPTTSSLCAGTASAAYTPPGGAVTIGLWSPAPTECGPFTSLAPAVKATDTLTVTTRAFDPAVSVPTGDLMKLAVGASAFIGVIGGAVELQPGQSTTIDVIITPSGTNGCPVSGTLFLDDFAASQPPYDVVGISEATALPYSYTIG